MLTQKGQSFIELLMAMAIFVLTSSAAILLFFGGQSLSVDSVNSQLALDYASEGMEAARSIKERDWAELTDGDHGLVYSGGQWQLSGVEDSRGKFTRRVTVSALDDGTKKVEAEISWQTDSSRPQNITLVMELTNWEIAQEEQQNYGGDPPSGGSGISGDWANPTTLGSTDLKGFAGGIQATDLDVLNKIVYLTTVHNDSEKEDFFIINAVDGRNPYVVAWANTGPGLSAIDVAGDYAYAANKSVNGQLQIIAITGSVVPELKTTFKLQSDTPSCNTSEEGKTVFYYDQKVYVGTETATGKEFFIVDVSNPLSPSVVGCKEIGADVNAIYIKDGIAYLATSANDKELQIFDVNNPVQINYLGGYDAPGTDDGRSIGLVGNKLYLGRRELRILNVVDPAAVQNLGSINLGADLNDFRVRDSLAFLGTSNANQEFQVWNISSPATTTLVSYYNFPQVASGIDYEDNIVYVAVRSNDALRIITSTQ